jgi:hypothetical protein
MVISGTRPQSLPAPYTVPIPARPIPLSQVLSYALPFLPLLFPSAAARPSALTYGIPGVASPGLSTPGIGVGPAQPPLGNPFPGASPSPVPAPNPLTALQPIAVPYAQPLTQTETDRCNCAKKKPRKKPKDRTVCYSGTFTERRKGTNKIRKRKVKCK